jgi:hypothetical protein
VSTRALLAAFVVVTLLAGCTSSGGSAGGSGSSGSSFDPAAQAAVEKLRAQPFGESQVDGVVAVLHTAGVGVYADGSAGGAEPLRFLHWQVVNLATEAANGGGIRGATLDSLTGRVDGVPPVSYLIAAWVSSYPSPAAAYARALLGTQDWHHAPEIAYPKLVVTLFTADALAAGPHGYVARPAVFAARADGPCTAVANFIQQAIADVAAALKVDTSGGGILGFLGGIWNVAVDLAAGVVRGLLKAVQGLLLQPLVEAFALLATIDQVTSYLVQWRARSQRLPADTRYGVDSEVVNGKVEVDVTDNQLPVPAVIRDCSKHFGSDLDKIGSAAGAPIAWTKRIIGPADLATQTAGDDKLTEERSATFTYQTGQESADAAASADSTDGFLQVTATIDRYDLDEVRKLLNNLIHSAIPPGIADIVARLAAPIIQAATELFRDLTDIEVRVDPVRVTYHHDEKKPSAKASPVPSVSKGQGRLPRQCPGAARISDLSGIYFDLGEVNNLQPPTAIQVTCEYGSASKHIEMRLTLSKWDIATQGSPAGASKSEITIPGADRAWRGTDEYNQEAVTVLVGDHVLAIGIAYVGTPSYFGVKLVTGIIAHPEIGPFIGPTIG